MDAERAASGRPLSVSVVTVLHRYNSALRSLANLCALRTPNAASSVAVANIRVHFR